jgi:hypothetical protein
VLLDANYFPNCQKNFKKPYLKVAVKKLKTPPRKYTHTHTHTPKMRAQSFPQKKYKKKKIVLG